MQEVQQVDVESLVVLVLHDYKFLGSTLFWSRRAGRFLYPECSDEDVDDDDDEDEGGADVLQQVQMIVFTLIIQIPLHNEDEQNSNDDLQDEGDADEGDESGVEAEGRALLKHSL